MVMNEEEYQKLYHKNKDKAIYEGGETYEVHYWYQKPDTFWEDRVTLYYSGTKDAHDEVKERFLKDYPKAKFIKVIYQ